MRERFQNAQQSAGTVLVRSESRGFIQTFDLHLPKNEKLFGRLTTPARFSMLIEGIHNLPLAPLTGLVNVCLNL